jgi:hypothetical protein
MLIPILQFAEFTGDGEFRFYEQDRHKISNEIAKLILGTSENNIVEEQARDFYLAIRKWFKAGQDIDVDELENIIQFHVSGESFFVHRVRDNCVMVFCNLDFKNSRKTRSYQQSQIFYFWYDILEIYKFMDYAITFASDFNYNDQGLSLVNIDSAAAGDYTDHVLRVSYR